MSLFRSKTVPPDRFGVVLGDTSAFGVPQTQVGLRPRIPLFRRETEPPDSFRVVLGDTPSVSVHPTQVGLRRRIPLCGEGFPFKQCGRIVALVVGVQTLLEIASSCRVRASIWSRSRVWLGGSLCGAGLAKFNGQICREDARMRAALRSV